MCIAGPGPALRKSRRGQCNGGLDKIGIPGDAGRRVGMCGLIGVCAPAERIDKAARNGYES